MHSEMGPVRYSATNKTMRQTQTVRQTDRQSTKQTYNDVGRLDITVNNVERMQIMQSGKQLRNESAHILLGVFGQAEHILQQVDTLSIHTHTSHITSPSYCCIHIRSTSAWPQLGIGGWAVAQDLDNHMPHILHEETVIKLSLIHI